MDYKETIQTIIDCIEEHIQLREEPIQKEEIEQLAGCSYDFFLKVFSYLYGISLSTYIRNRKMTLAGFDVKSTRMKVIDISLKYGYESPTSFTKAFASFHHITPSQARHPDATLQIYPKMQSKIQQKSQCSIVKKEAFTLVGKQRTLSTKDEQHETLIPAFWNECHRDGSFAQLISFDEADEKGMFGVFVPIDNEHINYWIGVTSSKSNEHLSNITIPKMTWAIFDFMGRQPDAIQQGWKYLYHEWMNGYPFVHGEAPELEWYSAGNMFDKNYHSQIWIPIKEEDV